MVLVPAALWLDEDYRETAEKFSKSQLAALGHLPLFKTLPHQLPV